MVRLCLHWLLFMAANVIAITLWTRLMDTPVEPWEATFTLAWQRIVPFALVSCALVPVFVMDALKLSNRFAGPIVRVRRVLAAIADGQPPKNIEFRQGDFWKSLASDLNRAFARRSGMDASSAKEQH